jgi:hypothetical protein
MGFWLIPALSAAFQFKVIPPVASLVTFANLSGYQMGCVATVLFAVFNFHVLSLDRKCAFAVTQLMSKLKSTAMRRGTELQLFYIPVFYITLFLFSLVAFT